MPMPRTDEMIKKDVVDSLYWDARVDASDIEVKVNNHIVELNGRVPSFRAKSAAMDDSRIVRGVSAVLNNLEVGFGESQTLPSDQEIRSTIENAINWDPDFDGSKINVEVASGLVTLEGVVDALWKKVFLKGVVESSVGVWKVADKLAIVPSGDFQDEEIARDLDAALERNDMVERNQINVKVEDGAVELSGKVPNSAAENAVFNTALYTRGVESVRNELKIDVN